MLEADHRLLGKERVDDDEIALVLGDVLQRHVRALVPTLAVLVVEDRVAVRERAASRVLPGKAHVVAIGEERGTMSISAMPQSTGCLPAAICLRASITRDGRMQRNWPAAVTRSPRRWSSSIGTCVSAASVHFAPTNGAQSTANLDLKFEGTGLTVCWPASSVSRYDDQALGLVLLDHALGDELAGIEPAGTGMLGNLLVHERLRDQRLVLLVVAELAEARCRCTRPCRSR